MFAAPFVAWRFDVRALIIVASGTFLKCANLIPFLPCKRKDRARYLAQAHLCDVAYSDAEGVCRPARVEVCDMPEVVVGKEALRIKPAAGKEHMHDAVVQRRVVALLDAVLVHPLESASLN
jgi:hypothetical protein